jgi:hypothetical protein
MCEQSSEKSCRLTHEQLKKPNKKLNPIQMLTNPRQRDKGGRSDSVREYRPATAHLSTLRRREDQPAKLGAPEPMARPLTIIVSHLDDSRIEHG